MLNFISRARSLPLISVSFVLCLPIRAHSETTPAAVDLDKKSSQLKSEEQAILKELDMLSIKPAKPKTAEPVRAKANIEQLPAKAPAPDAPAPVREDFNRTFAEARANALADESRTIERQIDTAPAESEVADHSVLMAQLRAKNDLSELVKTESKQLRSELKSIGKDLDSLKNDFNLTAQSYAKKDITQDRRMAALESDLQSVRGARDRYNESVQEHQSEHDALNSTLKQQQGELESLKISGSQLRARTEESERSVEEMNSGLAEIKATVQKLQGGLDDLTLRVSDNEKRSDHAVYTTTPNGDIMLPEVPLDGPRYSYVPHNAVTDLMQIVVVSVDEAELRSGPGETDTVVGKSPRGSRLAVEDATDDWYRVIAPDGSRAWIQARNVIFNREDEMSALRITGANEQY